MKYLVFIMMLWVTAFGQPDTLRKPVTTDQLEISVTGRARNVIQTSRGGGYYITSTNADVPPATAGWYVNGEKVLSDYEVRVDGHPLKRSDVSRTLVYPHQMIREYRNGTREIVTLIDNTNALLIELDSVQGDKIDVRPYLDDVRDTSELVMRVQYGQLYIGKKNRFVNSRDEFPDLWLGLLLSPGTTFSYVFYEEAKDDRGYSPASMHSSIPSHQFLIEFFVSANPKRLVDIGVNTMKNFLDSVYDRRVRMDQMMKGAYLRTNREDLTRSLNWAKVSLDALSLGTAPGRIWSGVPFGDRYEARTIFSSVPGIILGTGNLQKLKPVFRAFAATQDTNPSSGSYGCISDDLSDVSGYTDADATPLFVSALGTYIGYSGDSLFAAEMFPWVRRSIEGTLRYRCDTLRFLKHGDYATWMDIPRGNRADDIQAYWYQQLQTGITLSGTLHNDALREEVAAWREAASTLEANFRRYFVDSVAISIADHLVPADKADPVVRPNQFMDNVILAEGSFYQSLFARLTPALVTPSGVATRSVLDSGFCPVHYGQPLYPPSRCAYEGVLHPWLAGEWITQAARFGLPDSAIIVTRNQAKAILNGPTLGTLPEMMDAEGPGGDSLLPESGYLSSARSLAEYLRSWYEGYLGVSVDRMGSRLTLRPNLPGSVTDVDFDVPVGSSRVAVHYRKMNNQMTVELWSPPGTHAVHVVLLAPVISRAKAGLRNSSVLQQTDVDLKADKRLVLVIGRDGVRLAEKGSQEHVTNSEFATGVDQKVMKSVHLVPGGLNWRMPAGRKTPFLSLKDVKRSPQGSTVIEDVADAAFNDSLLVAGGDRWVQDLKRGILDVTHFTVRMDSASMYFTITYRDLSYPTRHPEYGFDHTITAVAIDKEGGASTRSSTVGRNAQYTFPNFSFSDIIYIGKGLSVEDAEGNILAQYFPVPADVRQPLGEYALKSVSFSLPLGITGRPSAKWKYALVTGVRDDSGGDIGTFRTVSRQPLSGTEAEHLVKGNIFDLVHAPAGK